MKEDEMAAYVEAVVAKAPPLSKRQQDALRLHIGAIERVGP